jgi:hypothetical protein
MTLKTGLVYAILASALIFLTACSIFRDQPIGDRNHIIVLADENVWQLVADPLTQVYGREIQTPQPEQTYYLERVDMEQLSTVSRRPYLLIVAPLKSANPVSVYLSNSLAPQAADGVSRGDYYVFSKSDLWARDQLVLFLTAPDLPSLLERIQENGAELYSLIDHHRNQAVQKEMYARLEQKNLEKQFHEKYGWRLRVQHDYRITIDDPVHNIVRLRRNFPDRWLTISWIDGTDQYLNLKATSAVRDSLGKFFKDPVFTYPEYHKYREIEFLGRPAGLLRGLWATEADIGGGPFFTYVIYDSSLHRTFFLDGAVFAPDRLKEPYLRQVQIMAKTFVPGRVN